jgi:hypothetical protein
MALSTALQLLSATSRLAPSLGMPAALKQYQHHTSRQQLQHGVVSGVPTSMPQHPSTAAGAGGSWVQVQTATAAPSSIQQRGAGHLHSRPNWKALLPQRRLQQVTPGDTLGTSGLMPISSGDSSGSSSSIGSNDGSTIDWGAQFDQQGSGAATSSGDTGATSDPGDPTAGDNSNLASTLLSQQAGAGSSGSSLSSTGPTTGCTTDVDCTSNAGSSGVPYPPSVGGTTGVTQVCPPASLVEAAVTPSPVSTSSSDSGVPPSSLTPARFCSAPPPGGLLLSGDVAGRLWYYPLTGGLLSSWPSSMYGGASFGDVTWVTDDAALGDTTVMECGAGKTKHQHIDNTPHDATGLTVTLQPGRLE